MSSTKSMRFKFEKSKPNLLQWKVFRQHSFLNLWKIMIHG